VATVKTAYRFALDPTPVQEHALRSHAGAARFAWNWALARCKERYAAERKWYSGAELHKLWNAAKKADPGLAWWSENSKCAYQEAFRNLDRALSDFVKSKKGLRKGKRLGFPRWKKKGKARDSFRVTETMRCAGGTVTLPRLGVIRTYEDTSVLASRIGDGTARNLLSLAASGAERLNARGAEVRPGPAGHTVLKREPGTRPLRGKTGTAPQQCEAAV
jgi:putative transposase